MRNRSENEIKSIENLRPTMLSTLPEDLTPYQAKYILDVLYLIEDGYEPFCNGSVSDLCLYLSQPPIEIKDWANEYSPMILEIISSRLYQVGGIVVDNQSNIVDPEKQREIGNHNDLEMKSVEEDQEKMLDNKKVSFA